MQWSAVLTHKRGQWGIFHCIGLLASSECGCKHKKHCLQTQLQAQLLSTHNDILFLLTRLVLTSPIFYYYYYYYYYYIYIYIFFFFLRAILYNENGLAMIICPSHLEKQEHSVGTGWRQMNSCQLRIFVISREIVLQSPSTIYDSWFFIIVVHSRWKYPLTPCSFRILFASESLREGWKIALFFLCPLWTSVNPQLDHLRSSPALKLAKLNCIICSVKKASKFSRSILIVGLKCTFIRYQKHFQIALFCISPKITMCFWNVINCAMLFLEDISLSFRCLWAGEVAGRTHFFFSFFFSFVVHEGTWQTFPVGRDMIDYFPLYSL